MINLDLYRIFEERGIENPHAFLRKNGFTIHTTSRLLNNKLGSINYKKLEQLCMALNCTPDDIFKWSYKDESGLYKDHALQKLNRGKRKGLITQKLKQLPLDKMTEVRKYIDQILETEKE